MGGQNGEEIISLTNYFSIFENNGYQSNLSKFHQIDNFLVQRQIYFLSVLKMAPFLRIQPSKISADLFCFSHLCYKQVLKNKFLGCLSQLQLTIADIFLSYSSRILASSSLFLSSLANRKIERQILSFLPHFHHSGQANQVCGLLGLFPSLSILICFTMFSNRRVKAENYI